MSSPGSCRISSLFSRVSMYEIWVPDGINLVVDGINLVLFCTLNIWPVLISGTGWHAERCTVSEIAPNDWQGKLKFSCTDSLNFNFLEHFQDLLAKSKLVCNGLRHKLTESWLFRWTLLAILSLMLYAFRRVCLAPQARIEPTHEVLEIGFGWGSMAIEIVRRTGCRYTGITLSKEQLKFAQKQVKEAGLEVSVPSDQGLLSSENVIPKSDWNFHWFSLLLLFCLEHHSFTLVLPPARSESMCGICRALLRSYYAIIDSYLTITSTIG